MGKDMGYHMGPMTDSIIQWQKHQSAIRTPKKHTEKLDMLEPLGENIIELLGPSWLPSMLTTEGTEHTSFCEAVENV